MVIQMNMNKPQVAKSEINAIYPSFQMLLDNKELMFQVLDMFPIPIEIFALDGTSVFCNRVFLEFNKIPDSSLIVGKYNVLTDPVINDQLGYREYVQRAFRGEIVTGPFSPSSQDLVNRGIVDEKPFEVADMDIYLYPVWNGDQLAYVVFVCIVKSVYQGRLEVVRTKEYIDTHWRDEFDPRRIANSVNMSVTKLYRIFKQYTGITPGEYHKKCKVDRIKEKLANNDLSIKEAFAACGEDSQGRFVKIFKKIAGLSPKQFREQNF